MLPKSNVVMNLKKKNNFSMYHRDHCWFLFYLCESKLFTNKINYIWLYITLYSSFHPNTFLLLPIFRLKHTRPLNIVFFFLQCIIAGFQWELSWGYSLSSIYLGIYKWTTYFSLGCCVHIGVPSRSVGVCGRPAELERRVL